MTTQNVPLPSNLIRRQLSRVRQELADYREVFRLQMDQAVAGEMSKFAGLRSLSTLDRERIWLTVSDAARRYHCVRWGAKFREAIRWRPRLIFAALTLVSLLAYWFVSAMPSPPFGRMNGEAILVGLTVGLVGCSPFGIALHYRLNEVRKNIVNFGELTIFFLAVWRYRIWAASVRHLWLHFVPLLPFMPPLDRQGVLNFPVAEAVDVALWLLAIVATINVAGRTAYSFAKIEAAGRKDRYSRAAEQCSEVIIGLLDICDLATTLAIRVEDATGDGMPFSVFAGASAPMDQYYYWERMELTDAISRLIAVISRPWPRAMSSESGSAGRWIANCAPEMEFFLRYQLARIPLASTSLIQFREVMTSALVDAAKGDWHLIAVKDDAATASLRHYQKRRAWRQITGLAVPLAIAGVLIGFRHAVPSSYSTPVILTCITFAVVQALGLLDPDIPAKIDISSRVAGMVRRSGHSGG